MERVDSEEEEEEVVIHLTSANPQVKGTIIHLAQDSPIQELKLRKNNFSGLDEPNSQMGLGHQIVHSSLFSKWVKKITVRMMAMILMIEGIMTFMVIIIITILLSSGSGMIWHLSLQSTILHVDSEEVADISFIDGLIYFIDF